MRMAVQEEVSKRLSNNNEVLDAIKTLSQKQPITSILFKSIIILILLLDYILYPI